MYRNRIEDLIKWKNSVSRKPLIIEGARQVGKTYLIKHFAEQEFKQVFYLNFEDKPKLTKIFNGELNPQTILEAISFEFNKVFNVDQDILILDEIQAGERALTALKYFCEDLPKCHVIAAGSLLGVGLNKSSFPVGKVSFLKLYPLSFEEFLLAANQTIILNYIKQIKEDPKKKTITTFHSKIWSYFKDYLIVGGMPEAVLGYLEHKDINRFEAYENVRKIQNNLLNQYLSDIAKHSGKINALHIERVLRNLPVNLARETEVGVNRYRFKDVIPGNNRYEKFIGPIDWLTKSGLVNKVPIVGKVEHPLQHHTRENIFKLYLFDTGLLGALAGLPHESIYKYEFGTFKGFLAENFVLQELLSSGLTDVYSWHEQNYELDFVLPFRDSFLAIEVKSGLAIKKTASLKKFIDLYLPQKSYILSGKSDLQLSDSCISYCPLYLIHILNLIK